MIGIVAAGATVVAAPSLALAPSAGAALSSPTSKTQAVNSYAALQRNYYLSSKHLYKGTPTNTCATYACLWPFTNATAGTIFLYGTPGESRYLADTTARALGLTSYADSNEVSPTGVPQPPAYQSAVAPPLGPGGTTYYDDNAWVGLNLVHAYLLTANTIYLTAAQNEFDFVVTGWDTASTDPCPGGVFWKNAAGSQRNATANGANAELGAELAMLAKNASDLTWAQSMYQWTVSCLGTASGLYNDHINPDGSINNTIWSYNQGVMVGAGVLLSRATGNPAYLAQAKQTANAAVSQFGTGLALVAQGTAFNAIYFRNLFLLNQDAPNAAYAAEAASFGSTMWSQRTLAGLFNPQYGVNGTAPMVEIYALLAGSPPVP